MAAVWTGLTMVSPDTASHTVSHPMSAFMKPVGRKYYLWGMGDPAPDPLMSWRFRFDAPCPVVALMCPSARVPGRTTANLLTLNASFLA